MYMRTYVRTCLSRSGMSNLHLLLALTCTLRNSWVTCTAAVSPQRTCFAESSTERSRRFVTLRKRKLQTKSTYKRSQEDKKRTRQSANGESSQARYMLWRVFTSQVHVVESLHKPGTRCGESSQARYTLWRVFTSQVHVVESLHKPDIHFHV